MRERILIVEDNPFNLEMLCDWLMLQDYEIATATTIAAAISAMEKFQPDAVLLDIQLGAEDGLTLAEWARRSPLFRQIPVIAVTAHAMMTDRDRILEAGCNTYVSKPIEFQVLQEQLRKWLVISSVLKSAEQPVFVSPPKPSIKPFKEARDAK